MMFKFLVLVGIVLSGNAAAASNVGVEKVLGRLILNSAGSSSGSAYLSVGVETKGRNIIELHFVSVVVAWYSTDITAFDKDRKIESVDSVMIDCRRRRYSPYPNDNGTQFAWNEYLSGKKYAWGDYSAEDFIYNVRKEEKDKMTSLFKDACVYTDA